MVQTSKITKAQIEEATLYWERLIENEPIRKAAEERYLASVKECNYSDCMHFDEHTRHCSLEICAYDDEDSQSEAEELEDGEFDWVE